MKRTLVIVIAIFFSTEIFATQNPTIYYKDTVRTPDGGILVAKVAELDVGHPRLLTVPVLTKYNSAGKVDISFGQNGSTILSQNHLLQIIVRGFAIAPDGLIYVLATATVAHGGNFDDLMDSFGSDIIPLLSGKISVGELEPMLRLKFDQYIALRESIKSLALQEENSVLFVLNPNGQMHKFVNLNFLGQPVGPERLNFFSYWNLDTNHYSNPIALGINVQGNIFILTSETPSQSSNESYRLYKLDKRYKQDTRFNQEGYVSIRGTTEESRWQQQGRGIEGSLRSRITFDDEGNPYFTFCDSGYLVVNKFDLASKSLNIVATLSLPRTDPNSEFPKQKVKPQVAVFDPSKNRIIVIYEEIFNYADDLPIDDSVSFSEERKNWRIKKKLRDSQPALIYVELTNAPAWSPPIYLTGSAGIRGWQNLQLTLDGLLEIAGRSFQQGKNLVVNTFNFEGKKFTESLTVRGFAKSNGMKSSCQDVFNEIRRFGDEFDGSEWLVLP